MRDRLWVLCVAFVMTMSCSLFTDLNGFSTTQAPPADGGVGDGGTPLDASSSATDASSTELDGANGADANGGPYYELSTADCIPLTGTPNPDECEDQTGRNMISTDLEDDYYAPVAETAVFLRFEPARTLTGTVTRVRLQLTLVPGGSESTDDSGEVWSVPCFDRPSLFTSVPAKTTRLAGSLGAIQESTDAVWTLPTSIVESGKPVCLGVFSIDEDATTFHNKNGTKPPRLIVETQ